MTLQRDFSSLVAVDVETSGPDPSENQLLSVAFAPLMPGLPALSIFVSQSSIQWGKTASEYFLNYKDEWEHNAVPVPEAYQRVSEYLKSLPFAEIILVGHNVGFDISFLKQLQRGTEQGQLPKVSHRSIDTHSVLYLAYLLGRIPRSALTSSGAFEHFGISPLANERHTAIADAKATGLLFQKLLVLFSS